MAANSMSGETILELVVRTAPSSGTKHRAFAVSILRPVDLGLTVVFLAGFAAWGTAIDRLPTDYDEVYHAHAVWLIAQGDRPYYDFLAVHTPFLWYAGSPLLRWLPDSPRMLLPLRISAGIGIVAWLSAFAANLCCNKSNLSLRWMLAGLGVVLFSAPVLAYAVEFRPDSWAFALFFWALFILRKQGTQSTGLGRYACYACLATGAALACLKVAPLAVMFALFDSLRLMAQRPRLADRAAGPHFRRRRCSGDFVAAPEMDAD